MHERSIAGHDGRDYTHTHAARDSVERYPRFRIERTVVEERSVGFNGVDERIYFGEFTEIRQGVGGAGRLSPVRNPAGDLELRR